MSEERTEQKTIKVSKEERVGVGTVVSFFDTPTASKKAKKRWLRGYIISKTTIKGNPIFLIARENGSTYLVMHVDIRKDTITKEFKLPEKFHHLIADGSFLKTLEQLTATFRKDVSN